MSNSLPIQSLSSRLQQKLQDPFTIAALASLALHGIVFAFLPILPLSTQDSEDEVRPPVPLIELSPDEQSRLPDFTTNPLELPSTSPDSDLFTLSPLPAPPPFQATPPDFSPLYVPPTPPLFFRNLPTAPPQSSTPPRRIIPTPPGVQSAPVEPPTASESEQRQTPPPMQYSGETREAPELGESIARADSSGLFQPRSADEAGGADESNDPPQSPEAESDPALQALRQRAEELRALLTYNESGTTRGDAAAASQTWFDQMDDSWSRLLDESADAFDPQVEISAPFPIEACFRSLENAQAPVIGARIGEDGKVVDDPAILRKSGYGILDQQALETVENYEFEATGKRQIYLITVQMERTADDCPEANPAADTPASESAG